MKRTRFILKKNLEIWLFGQMMQVGLISVTLMDGTSLQVMREFVQPSSYAPQIAEQHSGQLSQVFSYEANPGSSSRPAVFGGNKRKDGALVKVIHAEMTQNGYGSPEW